MNGLLVLSRHVDQKITIDCGGKLVEILVVEIRKNKVRLGIHAPAEFAVTCDDAINREPRERRVA